MNEISVLIKRNMRKMISLCRASPQGEDSCLGTRMWFSQHQVTAFPAAGTVRSKGLLFKLPSLQYSVMAARAA